MLPDNRKYAIITGASQGLGKLYAFELAKMGYPLLLVAKGNEGLCQLSKLIEKKYQVPVHYFETDLTKFHCLKELVNWINNNYAVKLLINNAGVGVTEKFGVASIDLINKIIKLNIRAVSFITHELLPNLLRTEGKSYVLNVSSMAAFCPMGYKLVYPASKKFIQHFSEGLNYELKNENISVATVFPGPMETNSNVSARIKSQGFMVGLMVQPPEKVARISIEKLFKGKTFILVGFLNKINYLLLKIIPTFIIAPLMMKRLEKEINLKPTLHAARLLD